MNHGTHLHRRGGKCPGFFRPVSRVASAFEPVRSSSLSDGGVSADKLNVTRAERSMSAAPLPESFP